MSYSPWILSPPLSIDECGMYPERIVNPDEGNALATCKTASEETKKLFSCLKTAAHGVKVIRIEIYEANQFTNMEQSICKCNAELCSQHVVTNKNSDLIYAKVRDVLKSMDNNLYVAL